MIADTPAALGFRLPAEWEPQEAVWLSWPRDRVTWPTCFDEIQALFGEIVAAIARFEPVRVNIVENEIARARHLCEAAGAAMERVEFYLHPNDDVWCRDHGPLFVKNDRTGEVAVTDWNYDAWGKKFEPYDADNRVPERVAATLKLRRFPNPMTLEGGSVEVNGQGVLLTTDSCLLNPNRNPHLTRADIEGELRAYLGVTEIVWLGEGIEGDDTDGHIDDITRFIRSDALLTAVEPNPDDPNHRPLAENLEKLRALRTAAGRPYEIREMPMPEPCHRIGKRMPSSYVNYLVLNGAVLMPTFRQPGRDAEAAEILADCFPGREIVGIDCYDIVLESGTIHCMTQQQPS